MISYAFDERPPRCHRPVEVAKTRHFFFLLQCSNQIAGDGGLEQDSKDEAPPERKRMRLFDHRKEEIIAIM